MTILPVEIFLVCAHAAGIIPGRSAIIADATGRAGILSGTIQFTFGSTGSLRFGGAGLAAGWLR